MSKTEIAASEWMAVTAAIDACRQQLRSCERTVAHYQDDDGDYHDGEQYETEKAISARCCSKPICACCF